MRYLSDVGRERDNKPGIKLETTIGVDGFWEVVGFVVGVWGIINEDAEGFIWAVSTVTVGSSIYNIFMASSTAFLKEGISSYNDIPIFSIYLDCSKSILSCVFKLFLLLLAWPLTLLYLVVI